MVGAVGGGRSSTARGSRRSPPPGKLVGDLEALLAAERHAPEQPLLEALLACRAGAGQGLSLAAERLIGQGAPWAAKPGEELGGLLSAVVEERDRSVFVSWSLARRGRPSLATLGAGLGVTGTRAAQRRVRAESRVREAMAEGPASVRWMAASLRRRLGTVALEEDAEQALTDHRVADGRTTGGRVREAVPCRDLALWLAGPYQEVPGRPGWLSTDPRSLAAATEAIVSAEGGVRPRADVWSELDDLGVAEGAKTAWLSACGAAVVDDLVVSTEGSIADAAERILEAHGRPLTAIEVAACLDRGGRPVAVEDLVAKLGGPRFGGGQGAEVSLATWAETTPGGRSARDQPEPARAGPPGTPGRPARSAKSAPPRPATGRRPRSATGRRPPRA
ncbi:MAG: hypothetical protein ACRD0J_16525, partial [Acidimicrobiales bacterium]